MLGDFDFAVPFNHEDVGTCWQHPTQPDSCSTGTPFDPADLVLGGDVHEDEDGSYNELVFHDAVSAFGLDVLWKEDGEDGAPLVFDVAGVTFELSSESGFVGVVSDVVTNVAVLEPLVKYSPLSVGRDDTSATIVMRAAHTADAAIGETIRLIREMDPAVTPPRFMTMDERIGAQMGPQQLGAARSGFARRLARRM